MTVAMLMKNTLASFKRRQASAAAAAVAELLGEAEEAAEK
jgi:5,10-methylene-tetrahydrofolate dehydrogenase/methenyl tetrahydrofolate cyclohydrolase